MSDAETEASDDTTVLLTQALLQTTYLSPQRLGGAVPESHRRKPMVFETPDKLRPPPSFLDLDDEQRDDEEDDMDLFRRVQNEAIRTLTPPSLQT